MHALMHAVDLASTLADLHVDAVTASSSYADHDANLFVVPALTALQP